jgi:L-lactate utilization protein LutB
MPEHLYATDNTDFARLLSLGFSAHQAIRLVHMKSHVSEEVEYREILEENRRLNFIRWLIDHNRLSN